ncbi:hypothetical protein PoB_004106500 [Plakobranchus ocellatus]|uniref:Uncharacterized protein n=1 Tax=Plakobranchus ocellatus TaxID=259542 RepID=A0AAV4B1U1_9GAST|nr:hypothetical protein PoB_004106500 [Plakobranchus ocellatus]
MDSELLLRFAAISLLRVRSRHRGHGLKESLRVWDHQIKPILQARKAPKIVSASFLRNRLHMTTTELNPNGIYSRPCVKVKMKLETRNARPEMHENNNNNNKNNNNNNKNNNNNNNNNNFSSINNNNNNNSNNNDNDNNNNNNNNYNNNSNNKT